jgi:kynurenine formamidase
MSRWSKLLALALVAAMCVLGSTAFADLKDSEWSPDWWKNNPWGKDDKAGAVNMVKPELVLKAAKLIKTGRHATLGKLYMRDYVFFGPRSWTLEIPGTPTGGPFGKNNLVYHDEFVQTEIGQVSTQFDGPGHIGVRTPQGDLFYNGRDREKTYERGAGGRVIGMGDLGVEHVAKIGYICRGVLLDAPGYKNMKRLPIPDKESSPGVVTEADVKGMVKKQGIADIGPGDCVFLYTGHGDLFLNDEWPKLSPEERAKRRAEFTSGEPGYGHSACSYFMKIPVMLTAGDTSANDAQPSDHGYAVPCHTMLQTRLGIWNLENLEFTQLLKDKAYEFMFVWAPLKCVGCTGSPGNPIAIY